MIKGIGVDVSKIPRFEKILQSKHIENFVKKVLNKREIVEIEGLKTLEQKSKYLASRWAAKEALVKATGDKGITFSKVYIAKDQAG
jgi:holo-[acyl-carrier protein] synthase